MNIRSITHLLVIATALCAVMATTALASHTKGETRYYTSDKPIGDLTKARAMAIFKFDLGKRAGTQIKKAKNVSCTLNKSSATCTYKGVNPFGAALGVESGFCVKNGKFTLSGKRKKIAVTQKAKDC